MKYISKIVALLAAIGVVVSLTPIAFASEVLSGDPPVYNDKDDHQIYWSTRGLDGFGVGYVDRLRYNLGNGWLLLKASCNYSSASMSNPWVAGAFIPGSYYVREGIGSDVDTANQMAIVQIIKVDDTGADESFGFFRNLKNIENIVGLDYLKFQKQNNLSTPKIDACLSIKQIFYGMTSLKSLDLSGWDMSSIVNMDEAFKGCEALTTIDFSGWDTSSVTSSENMFEGCSSLRSVVLSENFTLQQCLPDGLWANSAGELFEPADIPQGVADTYTKRTAVTGIQITQPTSTSLTIGAHLQLQASLTPADAEATVVWTSSDASIASVDATGKVTAVSPGRVTITATVGEVSSSVVLVVGSSVKPGDDPKPVVPTRPGSDPKPVAPTKPGASSSANGTTSKTQPMHRLYNPNSGEHFYTASAQERDVLVSAGWSYEDVGWIAPASSKTPVFRLYSGTDHHYTSSAAERDALVMSGWSDEGIGWYSDDAKGIPLYRQFNPNVDPAAPTNNSGSHNYTISQSENDFLCSNGWQGEGIGWYGCK